MVPQKLLLLLLIAACQATSLPRQRGRVVAYVGVRAGSKRCPNKNSKPFWGNASLIDVKLRTLLRTPSVDGIVFSSESDMLLDIGRAYESQGVTVKKRDPYFATATVSLPELFSHIASSTVVGEDADHVLYAPVTAPLMEVQDYEELVAAYRASDPSKVDAVTSVIELQGHFYFDDKPLNFHVSGPGATPGTQHGLNLIEVGYAAAVIDRETLLRTQSIIGANKPGFVVLPEERGLEIDSCFEFEMGQWAYERRNGPPPAGSEAIDYLENGDGGGDSRRAPEEREEL